MRVGVRNLSVIVVLLGLGIVISGCPGSEMAMKWEREREQKQRALEYQNNPEKYVAYAIYSDPPGAHVYASNGQYWGQTEESEPVRWVFSYKWPSYHRTISLKKRGYKTTEYSWTLYYKYDTEDEAIRHEKKIVVVLDLE